MALSRIGISADLANLFARSSSYAATNLAPRLQGQNSRQQPLHASGPRLYPEAPRLALPSNVSEIFNIETSRFTPERARDLDTPSLLHGSPRAASAGEPTLARLRQHDAHLDSYDCFGSVSLSGAMQTNVPKPFCSAGRSTHLNMPGGQWARDSKYLAEDMRKSHFNVYKMRQLKRYGGLDGLAGALAIRNYATAAGGGDSTTAAQATSGKNLGPETGKQAEPGMSQKDWLKLSKPERLKIIIRDYGRTVIVFHVGISLMSLGIFYGLVSSGLDLTSVIELFNTDEETEGGGLVAKITSEGSTFLIAYAIHKLFAPLRISATLIVTPMIVKYLRRKGILKPPKLAAKPS